MNGETNTLGTWKPEESLCCLSLRRLGGVLTTLIRVLEARPKKRKAPQSRPTGRAISVIENHSIEAQSKNATRGRELAMTYFGPS